MDPLKIPEGKDTPAVSFDYKSGVLEIAGKSFHEDAKTFYKPVIEWLEKYKDAPQSETTVNLKFTYFNTASSKMITEILDIIHTISMIGKSVTVNWHYFEVDDDMLISGEEIAEVLNMDFNFIPEQLDED